MTRINLHRHYRRSADRTTTRATGQQDSGGIFDGTVGWEDGEDHFETDSDSGITLVKVKLFKGRNPDTEPAKNNARAKGLPILCQISAPLFNIPPDGALVHVSMPSGRWDVPGAGVIVAQVVPSPGNQFNGTKSKMDFGPDYDLVIKARSITLTDYEDRYLTLGPKYGVKIGDAAANGCQLKNAQWLFYTAEGGTAKTTLRLSKSAGIALLIDDGKTVGLTMGGGKFVGMGEIFQAGFATGYLGKLPTAITGVGYGLGAASVQSTSWFVSPA